MENKKIKDTLIFLKDLRDEVSNVYLPVVYLTALQKIFDSLDYVISFLNILMEVK